MNVKVFVIILVFFVLYVSSTEDRCPVERVGPRCRCINHTTQFIHPRQMNDLDLIPNGPHCSRVEIIVTLKTGRKVCLNPEAPWVKLLIRRILKKDIAQGDSG
ncbi:alveolar macrophage chemotactic factor-like [Rhinoraja longicauda]